jgi:hypothetical protein
MDFAVAFEVPNSSKELKACGLNEFRSVGVGLDLRASKGIERLKPTLLQLGIYRFLKGARDPSASGIVECEDNLSQNRLWPSGDAFNIQDLRPK